jgi:hypothetical protein
MPGGSALIQADAKDLYASWRNIESAPPPWQEQILLRMHMGRGSKNHKSFDAKIPLTWNAVDSVDRFEHPKGAFLARGVCQWTAHRRRAR